MGLDYRRPHQLFGAEGEQWVAFQDGVLYTMDGKPVPHNPDEIARKKIHIPDHLKKFFIPSAAGGEVEDGALFLEFADLEVPEDQEVDERFVVRREGRGITFQETVRQKR